MVEPSDQQSYEEGEEEENDDFSFDIAKFIYYGGIALILLAIFLNMISAVSLFLGDDVETTINPSSNVSISSPNNYNPTIHHHNNVTVEADVNVNLYVNDTILLNRTITLNDNLTVIQNMTGNTTTNNTTTNNTNSSS